MAFFVSLSTFRRQGVGCRATTVQSRSRTETSAASFTARQLEMSLEWLEQSYDLFCEKAGHADGHWPFFSILNKYILCGLTDAVYGPSFIAPVNTSASTSVSLKLFLS